MKAPIICGREPTASTEEKKLGSERSAELSAKVNQASLSCWRSLPVLLACYAIYSIKGICYIFILFCASWRLIWSWWFLYDIQFILRRTNALLSNHLPPKVCLSVCSPCFWLKTKLYHALFILLKRIFLIISEEYFAYPALLKNIAIAQIVEVVCCKLTPLQTTLYNHFIHSKNVRTLLWIQTIFIRQKLHS